MKNLLILTRTLTITYRTFASVLKEMIDYEADYRMLLVHAGSGMNVKQVGAQRLVVQSTPKVGKEEL
jgi:hypothetical protein